MQHLISSHLATRPASLTVDARKSGTPTQIVIRFTRMSRIMSRALSLAVISAAAQDVSFTVANTHVCSLSCDTAEQQHSVWVSRRVAVDSSSSDCSPCGISLQAYCVVRMIVR